MNALGSHVVSRVAGSATLRRALPAAAAERLPLTRAMLRARMNPGEVAFARRLMAAVIGATVRSDEIDVLAERWMGERSMLSELLWRRDPADGSEVSGYEHYVAARDADQGVLLTFVHQGPWWAAVPPRAVVELDVLLPIDPRVLESTGGRQGDRDRRFRSWLDGVELISADGCAPTVLRRLAAGGTVATAIDLPGRRDVELLGRRIAFNDGPARLAYYTKSVVLPVVVTRSRLVPRLRLMPPIDAAASGSVQELIEAMVGAYEPHFLARPEALDFINGLFMVEPVRVAQQFERGALALEAR